MTGSAAIPSDRARRPRWTRLAVLSVNLVVAQTLAAQEPSLLHGPILVIDPSALEGRPAVLANFQATIAQETPIAVWAQLTLEEGLSPLRLSRRVHRYDDRRYPEVAGRIARVILDANQPNALAFRAGEEFSVPVLPRRPGQHADAGLAQLLNLDAATLQTIQTSLVEVTPSRMPTEEAGTWILTSGASDKISRVAATLDSLDRADGPRSFYFGPGTETVQLGSSEGQPAPNSDLTLKSLKLESISLAGSDLSRADVYHIVDQFAVPGEADSCTHGKRVVDVANEVFRTLGADVLGADIKIHNVSFPAAMPYALEVIDRFAARFAPGPAKAIRTLRAALASQTSFGKDEVPVLFLLALFDEILRDPEASVVSSSIWTNADCFPLLPAYGIPDSVLLCQALRNEVLRLELSAVEPIRSFFNRRNDVATVLAAGLAGGRLIGQTSMKDDAASVVGYGSGWGSPGTCIKPTEEGSSFATPAVAALAFAYREWRRSEGEVISALELRRRLFLSIDPLEAATGGYSAPGIPVTERLFCLPGAFCVGVDGGLAPVTRILGTVRFVSAGTGQSTVVTVGGGPFESSGLAFDGATWLLFSNGRAPFWRPVQLEGVDLCVERGPKSETVTDPGELQARYAVLVQP